MSLATAKATWDRQTKHLRIQIYKTPQDTKQFVDLTLMLTTDSGRVDRDKIDAYHMYLRCPEMQYNDNVTVHAFFNRDEFYQRFPHFSADLRKGGKVNIAFRGATKGPWEGLSWDFSVAATLP